MGSVKKHKKNLPFSETIQWRPERDNPGAHRYGYVPRVDNSPPFEQKWTNMFCPPYFIYHINNAKNFKRFL